MKKILVSDYDGTIYQDDNTTKENIKAIRRFMKNNIFAVATGRSYEDFKKAMDKYDIKCNYYLLNYGAEVLDQNMNSIYGTPFTSKELLELEEYFKKRKCTIYYCNEKENYLNKTEKTYKLVLVYDSKNEQMKDYFDFKQKYHYNVFVLRNHYHLEIISSSVDKAGAIELISSKYQTNKVFVIGDSENDKTMIEKYHGYCVDSACDDIKQISTKIYKSVNMLIDELLEDEV